MFISPGPGLFITPVEVIILVALFQHCLLVFVVNCILTGISDALTAIVVIAVALLGSCGVLISVHLAACFPYGIAREQARFQRS